MMKYMYFHILQLLQGLTFGYYQFYWKVVQWVFTMAIRTYQIDNNWYFLCWFGKLLNQKLNLRLWKFYVLIAEELLGQEILNLGQEDGLHDREGQRVMQVIKPSHDTFAAFMKCPYFASSFTNPW